jgi:hypothetical protein
MATLVVLQLGRDPAGGARRAATNRGGSARTTHASRVRMSTALPILGMAVTKRRRRRYAGAMAGTAWLVQLLLPVKPGGASWFADTRRELIERFQGVTAYVRSPAKGSWVGPEGEAHDDVLMVEVLVDDFDRAWWRTYAETLAKRFGEREIHIRALPATVP